MMNAKKITKIINCLTDRAFKVIDSETSYTPYITNGKIIIHILGDYLLGILS